MTTHDRVRQQLHVLETLLREHRHWRLDAPQAHLFTSTQPFFMDTMEPLEWLQWVLIHVCIPYLIMRSHCPRRLPSPLIMKWRWRRIIRKGGDPGGFAGSGCAIRPR